MNGPYRFNIHNCQVIVNSPIQWGQTGQAEADYIIFYKPTPQTDITHLGQRQKCEISFIPKWFSQTLHWTVAATSAWCSLRKRGETRKPFVSIISSLLLLSERFPKSSFEVRVEYNCNSLYKGRWTNRTSIVVFKKYLFYVMYVSVLPACMSVFHVYVMTTKYKKSNF